MSIGPFFVANIPWSVTTEELKELFARFGQVNECIIIMDKVTGRSRGFGFANLPNEAEAQSAIAELDGYV